MIFSTFLVGFFFFLFFVSFDVVFFFFVFFLFFFFFNGFGWFGGLVFIESFVYLLLFFIRILIFGLILFSEFNFVLVFFTKLLILISFFFFFPVNFFLFYVFFELSIFPVIVMVLGYGYQVEKVNSFFYLCFYATFFSLPFLFVYFSSGFGFFLCYFDFFLSWELVFLLTLAFMIKFPVFFLHVWLPKVHVEAPTTASILLAGLLLKFGVVGFIRVMKSLSFCHVNYWFLLSFFGMVLGSFCCVFQSDLKSLSAYSSVVHMNFLLFTLLFFRIYCKTRGLIMIISHGYISSLIFYFVGLFYSSVGSRMIYFLNSFMVSRMFFTFCFSFVFLCNCGIPPSLSFFSEFMSFTGFFSLCYNMFYLVFLYFFVSFYFCLYVVVCSFLGKGFKNFSC